MPYDKHTLLENIDTRLFSVYQELCLYVKVMIQEWDQTWIYGGITCRATNEFGQAELQIQLARAREF